MWAALAGLVWYPMIWLGTSFGGELTPLPELGPDAPPWRAFGWLVIWSTGAVYAGAVLVPLSRLSWYRVALLLIGGAFSYWAAVQFSVEWDPLRSTVANVALAGALAALFIGSVVVFVAGIAVEPWRWPALVVAGAVGGAMIGGAVQFLDDSDAWTWAPGHIVWEVATCAALWFRRAA